MDDWQDDRSILEQLLRLLRPESRDALAAASVRGFEAVAAEGSMGTLTAHVYARIEGPTPAAPLIADKDRLYEALDAASEVPHPVVAATRSDSAWIIRLAHVAVKFRYTRPGRWVARALPPGLQRRLKARLLASM